LRIAVVILAGGEGRRIGGAKPLRRLGNQRLIDRAVALAKIWSDVVAVSVREEEQAEHCGLPLLFDAEAVEGPLAGLVAGLRFADEAGYDGLLTIPADMPFLPNDLADRLSSAMTDRQAAIAASGGHLHPVCGLWPTSALEKVPAYLRTGSRSLRGFAAVVGYVAVEWLADPADPFFNINAVEDLAAAERQLR
jgi:molybdopterin-guanine dinucleotide biosynthesis protein A